MKLTSMNMVQDYWKLAENSTMQDVILSIRADESNHRFVNHSLASLDQKRDFR
jgi:ubiquinol oxidase